MSTHIDKDQFEYYLSSLDELGEILIEADQIESVSSGILRLTLGTIMASKGAIFVFERSNRILSELTSISIKEQFNNCTLSETFVENIRSYQYSHFEFDNSIDWIESDLKNYLESSNSKIIIPLFHKVSSFIKKFSSSVSGFYFIAYAMPKSHF